MSRSDNNKNSIFEFAKTLLGQKPGGVCRIDERYDEYVIENSPTEEQFAAQRREDFSGMPVIAVAIAGEDGDKLRRLTEDSVKEQTYSRWSSTLSCICGRAIFSARTRCIPSQKIPRAMI